MELAHDGVVHCRQDAAHPQHEAHSQGLLSGRDPVLARVVLLEEAHRPGVHGLAVVGSDAGEGDRLLHRGLAVYRPEQAPVDAVHRGPLQGPDDAVQVLEQLPPHLDALRAEGDGLDGDAQLVGVAEIGPPVEALPVSLRHFRVDGIGVSTLLYTGHPERALPGGLDRRHSSNSRHSRHSRVSTSCQHRRHSSDSRHSRHSRGVDHKGGHGLHVLPVVPVSVPPGTRRLGLAEDVEAWEPQILGVDLGDDGGHAPGVLLVRQATARPAVHNTQEDFWRQLLQLLVGVPGQGLVPQARAVVGDVVPDLDDRGLEGLDLGTLTLAPVGQHRLAATTILELGHLWGSHGAVFVRGAGTAA